MWVTDLSRDDRFHLGRHPSLKGSHDVKFRFASSTKRMLVNALWFPGLVKYHDFSPEIHLANHFFLFSGSLYLYQLHFKSLGSVHQHGKPTFVASPKKTTQVCFQTGYVLKNPAGSIEMFNSRFFSWEERENSQLRVPITFAICRGIPKL